MESYTNSQQDAIQSTYFGQDTFLTFTACGYTKEDGILVIISEISNISRLGSMICLEVVKKIEEVWGQNLLEKELIWYYNERHGKGPWIGLEA